MLAPFHEEGVTELETSDLRVLLVEDDPDFAELVGHILSTRLGCAVDVAGSLKAAMERSRGTEYDAVVLDLNLPDSSGINTFTVLRNRLHTPLVVLTAQEDESLALGAVGAGAEDYLVKADITPQLLVRRVRFAMERGGSNGLQQRRRKAGKIFTFFACKGGAGTTTLVLNTAAALLQGGKSVLAVELSGQYGSFSAQMGLTPRQTLGAVKFDDPDGGGGSVVSAVVELPFGVRALFGPQRPDQYQERTVEQNRLVVERAATLADFVVVDAGGAPLAARGILNGSSAVVLVAERGTFGMHAAEAAGVFLRSAAVEASACGLAVVTKMGLMEFEPPIEFSKRLGYRLLAAIPPAAEALHWNRSGAPVVLAAPDLPYSEAVRNLAASLVSGPVLTAAY